MNEGRNGHVVTLPPPPSYLESLPNPIPKRDGIGVPTLTIAMVDMERREPPPAYSSDGNIVVPTTSTANETNREWTRVSRAGQQALKRNKCMICFCFAFFVGIAVVFLIVWAINSF